MLELNKVYCKDNLELLKQIPDNYIDLIYCDILYGTGRKFTDYQDLKPIRGEIENHYIPRIKEMHRVLKPTGSIYLQMDYRINHWLRCIMDDIFGYNNFVREIIWENQGSMSSSRIKHQNIYFYAKTQNYINNKLYEQYQKEKGIYQRWEKYINKNNQITKEFYPKNDSKFIPYLTKAKSNIIIDFNKKEIGSVWYISSINNGENINYSTQKPKALLERIIKASSNENDTVADFYMGSGTSMVVAKELNRQFIGCDISQKAVDITNKRIEEVEKKQQENLF